MTRKVISLFTGAGGLDLGFEAAGFQIAVAVEADPSCCATLRRNKPELPIIEGPIETISSKRILEAAGLRVGEAALVIGGPPCQPFSLAGNRRGLEDPRGHLVKEFVRVVRETLPVGFVMENVRGLLNWSGGEAVDLIMAAFTEPILTEGEPVTYAVAKPKVLNAVDFGVPQFRERVFFVGNRLGREFRYPTPTHRPLNQPDAFGLKPYATVHDAIGKLPPPEPPSDTARRVAASIKGRIERHGY